MFENLTGRLTGILNKLSSKGRLTDKDIDDALGVPVPIKAGQCLFFHALMLHKSEGNFAKDRDRSILFLRYADADAVEVYNDRTPRLGRLVRGNTKYNEVRAYEAQLPLL